METTINTDVQYPCATFAAATLEVRGAAARGMKRAAFTQAHAWGSLTWSPPL